WQALGVTLSIGLAMLLIGLAFAGNMAKQIARGEAVHRLLLNELNPPVKETPADVQTVAAPTFPETPRPVEARKKFDGRLVSIGKTHALLSDEKWNSAPVREIVQNVLRPYAAEGSQRVRISGPDIRVEPRCAMMLSLALHELATNAAKYGALSSAAGRLPVIWEPTDPAGKTLKLTWSEADGPPVQVPQHRGFGSRLIEEAFPQQFEGRVSLAYEATGVR